MDLETRKKWAKIVNSYSSSLDSPKYPPWMHRKRIAKLQTIAHPEISKDFGVLSFATKESIEDNYGKLLGYFIDHYGLSQEIVETWLMYLATGSLGIMNENYMISPTLFIDHKRKIAWPSEDPEAMYLCIKKLEAKMEDPYVEIRIGRSTTKNDIKWILDHAWDSDIEPRLHKLKPATKKRVKPQFLRNSTAYYLHQQGKSVKDIRKLLEEYFPFKTAKKGEQQKVMTDVYVRKLIKEFKPETSWLEDAWIKLQQLQKNDKSLQSHSLELIFKVKPSKHFTFK